MLNVNQQVWYPDRLEIRELFVRLGKSRRWNVLSKKYDTGWVKSYDPLTKLYEVAVRNEENSFVLLIEEDKIFPTEEQCIKYIKKVRKEAYLEACKYIAEKLGEW